MFHFISLHTRNMSSTSHHQDDNVSFDAFYEGWLVRHEHYLEELLSVQQQCDEYQEDYLKDLITRVISHYQQYFEEKSRLAARDVFHLFSPTWLTSLECATLWVTDFKPGFALRLVGDAVQDLSSDQRERMSVLIHETKVEERVLNDEFARVQESLAAPPLVEVARRRGRRIGVNVDAGEEAAAMGGLRKKAEEVVAGADLLRMSTAMKVMEILSPVQTVKFLAAATQLFLKLRNLGLQKDGKK